MKELLKCSVELEIILQNYDMPAFPIAAKDKGVEYTDYLVGAHKHIFNFDPEGKEYVYSPDRNRQCAVGWHTECSLNNCGCVCHRLMELLK